MTPLSPLPTNLRQKSLPLQLRALRFFLPLLLLLFSFLSLLQAEDLSRDPLMKRYEEAAALAAARNVYAEDTLHIVPRLREGSRLIEAGNLDGAEKLLGTILSDLELLESKIPDQLARDFRLEWLEVYWEVIQKYALLAIFAFLFMQVPYYRRMLKAGRLSLMGRIYFCFLVGSAAVLFSLLDLFRYGASPWAFLDIQIVFLTIAGLLGGVWAGLACGLLVGIFRLVLSAEFWIYLLPALAAGLLGGFLSPRMGTLRKTAGVSFGCGLLAGLLHGGVVSYAMLQSLPPAYAAFNILVLGCLEGAGVFIFFAVISGLLREADRQEMEKELLKTQLSYLQAQISPHFLYNALNTVSSICAREGATQARSLVLKLADFFRGTLRHVDDPVTLEDELAHIDAYLEIEKARFQDRLKIEKDFKIQDDTWKIRVPFLLLQPLVENAVKHGIGKKESGGTLRIRLRDEGPVLKVEISDDGMGFDCENREPSIKGEPLAGTSGIGIRNIRERMTRFFGTANGLHFESEPENGTRVTVEIPLDSGLNERRKKRR